MKPKHRDTTNVVVPSPALMEHLPNALIVTATHPTDGLRHHVETLVFEEETRLVEDRVVIGEDEKPATPIAFRSSGALHKAAAITKDGCTTIYFKNRDLCSHCCLERRHSKVERAFRDHYDVANEEEPVPAVVQVLNVSRELPGFLRDPVGQVKTWANKRHHHFEDLEVTTAVANTVLSLTVKKALSYGYGDQIIVASSTFLNSQFLNRSVDERIRLLERFQRIWTDGSIIEADRAFVKISEFNQVVEAKRPRPSGLNIHWKVFSDKVRKNGGLGTTKRWPYLWKCAGRRSMTTELPFEDEPGSLDRILNNDVYILENCIAEEQGVNFGKRTRKNLHPTTLKRDTGINVITIFSLSGKH
ncbi:hypothetical protein BGX33_001869 [Mortierella sp. NVP41]|nr:hypothetical protein BGX33_001869 [Mortierella sp. NVP41]